MSEIGIRCRQTMVQHIYLGPCSVDRPVAYMIGESGDWLTPIYALSLDYGHSQVQHGVAILLDQ